MFHSNACGTTRVAPQVIALKLCTQYQALGVVLVKPEEVTYPSARIELDMRATNTRFFLIGFQFCGLSVPCGSGPPRRFNSLLSLTQVAVAFASGCFSKTYGCHGFHCRQRCREVPSHPKWTTWSTWTRSREMTAESVCGRPSRSRKRWLQNSRSTGNKLQILEGRTKRTKCSTFSKDRRRPIGRK